MLSMRFPHPSANKLSPLKSQRKRKESNVINNAFSNGSDGKESSLVLPEGLKQELMPKHVALILDGNRRWAKEKGLPSAEGHIAGRNAMLECARLCSDWGIKVLTVFAFSTENWSRPKEEVEFFMSLIEETMRYKIKACAIGDKCGLPKSLQDVMTLSEDHKNSNSGFHFVMAINYSGKYDILQATRRIATKVKDGVVRVEDVDETLLQQELETNFLEYPNPDLLIRPSGEIRISNFMLWQLAYTELYFSEKMLPDFGEIELKKALLSFQQRDRRYGTRK